MANTYTWIVEAMDCYPTYESQTDVVFTVHWRCNATSDQTHVVNGQTVPYTATIYSTQAVTYTAGSPYTPYSQLTQQEVLGWIWASGVSESGTQTALDTMIANQINPPVVSPALPWATQGA
jgi:hypothetical protein